MDLEQLVGKVKEFVYLLEDLTPAQVQGLGWRNSRSSCRSSSNAYDLKEGQMSSSAQA